MTNVAWAKMPSAWLLDGTLHELYWRRHKGDAIAALLVYIALCALLNLQKIPGKKNATRFVDPREVEANYDTLMGMTNVSRAKIAGGLQALRDVGAIEDGSRRGVYRLPDAVAPGSWCKLPQSTLIGRTNVLRFAMHLRLRSVSELDALKLYLFLLASRNIKTGDAWVGQSKIAEATGIDPARIITAKSHLFSWGLMTERVEDQDPMGRSARTTLYRMTGV